MKELFSKQTQAIFYNLHPEPIQHMLDYDWLCRRENPSIVAIVHKGSSGMHKAFFGSSEILIPVYDTVAEACKNHAQADVFVSFASMRSAFVSTKEAILQDSIRTVAVTAEGMPENQTRELIRLAKLNNVWFIGPATVGGIKPGAFRIGNTAGSMESIVSAKLYRPGSVGVVTVSGGMSLEMYHIISQNSDGVSEGIAVGGDTYPGTTLLENLLRLHSYPQTKMLVMLGEIGGKAEIEVAEAITSGKITKPIVAWVSGTVASQFNSEVQFGHANARSGNDQESAQAKNTALKNAGAYIPKSFNELGKTINDVFTKFVLSDKEYKEPSQISPQLSTSFRRPTSIVSSISDDRGAEPLYNKKEISSFVSRSIGFLLNQLWFKGKLNKVGEDFLELAVKLMADHGPAVATAHNAIVTARAGKDVIDSLIAGLTTIGPRHGGALDGAAKWMLSCDQRKISPREFIDEMKNKGELILGIGHKIRTSLNPDKRVLLLRKFAKQNLKATRYLNYALAVEQETLRKKNNLILNVDGATAAIFLDILKSSRFTQTEIEEIVDAGMLNGLFALSRSIGIIGHALDQKRLKQGLYRHAWDDILYM